MEEIINICCQDFEKEFQQHCKITNLIFDVFNEEHIIFNISFLLRINTNNFTCSTSLKYNKNNYLLSNEMLIDDIELLKQLLGDKLVEKVISNYFQEIGEVMLEKYLNNELFELNIFELINQNDIECFKKEYSKYNYAELLIYSSKKGKLEIVKILLENPFYYKILIKAIQNALKHNHNDVVKSICNKNFNTLSLYDNLILDFISISLINHNFNLVKYFIDTWNVSNYNLTLFLTNACHDKSLELTSYLWSKVNLNKTEKERCFDNALLGNNLDVIKFLTQQGININKKVFHVYPIKSAVQNCNFEIVKFLIESGIDLRDCLCDACNTYRDNTDIIKYLIEKGVDIHLKNDLPIKRAARFNKLEVVKILFQMGIDKKTLKSVMKYAYQEKNLQIMKFLIDNGVSMDGLKISNKIKNDLNSI